MRVAASCLAAIGLAGSAILGTSVVAQAAAQVRDFPVVLELFTSQGCSSCPPADALLGRLKAAGADVLPLSLHVDYWNRIGWRDPFSAAGMTARQYEYARRLGQDGVYTPELVVDGAIGVVGSDAVAVDAAIREARAAHTLLAPIDLHLTRSPPGIDVTIAAGAGSGRVLLIGYDDRHVTSVPSGENAGRILSETNVVRSIVQLGDWSGPAITLHAASPQGQHSAVLIQSAANGRMLAARALP